MAYQDFEAFNYRLSSSPIGEGSGSSVAESGGLDAPSDTSTTEVLTIGGSTSGAIGVIGDDDWYRVTLTAGQSYFFIMTGSGVTPLEDPYLSIYDSNGQLITWNDDGWTGRNAGLRYTPTTSGVYFLGATAWDDSGTGGYNLTAQAVAKQDPLDTIDWGTSLSSNQIKIYFAVTGEDWLDAHASRSWTTAEKAALMSAAQSWANVANVSFSEVSSSAEATMVLVLDPTIEGIGWMTTPPGLNVGAFDPSGPWWTVSGGLSPGGEGYNSLVHELGHALGLAHPHDDGGTSEVMEGVTDEFDSYGLYGLNQGVFTVMSYNDGWPLGPAGGPVSYGSGAEATPMALDIAVVQAKYGSVAHNANDTTYSLDAIAGQARTWYEGIWDTGGIDTIVWGSGNAVVIDLRAATLLQEAGGGGYVSGPVASLGGYTIAAGVVIENATSAEGADHLIGNAVANTLRGGGGNDWIEGGAGDDVIYPGQGNDQVDGGSGSDTVNFTDAALALVVDLRITAAQDFGFAGTDTLNSIENIIAGGFDDLLIGTSGANRLEGNNGSDQLYGLGGDDVLVAGSHAGSPDFLYGGSGNDTYYVNSSLSSTLDLVFEGGANPDLMAGVGDIDIIHSGGEFFWDFYSVGEQLFIDEAAGDAYLVGGKDVTNKQIFGSTGTDIISTYGHNAVVDAGGGTDAISFNLYGLDNSYRGANTVVMKPGSGTDYVYDFLSGTDHIDLSAFHFGISGAQVLAQAVNVDNPGTANDYCYFYLTSAGGVDNFIVFIGLLGSQLQAGDFIT